MLEATLAALGHKLSKDLEIPTTRVKYGTTDSFFNKMQLSKLQLPGVIYALNGINLPNGYTTNRNSFKDDSNNNDTETIELNVISARLTVGIGIVTASKDDFFELLHKYYEMTIFDSEFTFEFYSTLSNNPIVLDCSICEYEDVTMPPTGKDGSDYEETGLKYFFEAGFTVNSLLYFDRYRKLVRSVKTQLNIM